MMNLRRKPIVFIVALLLLSALAGAFLHHHAHGEKLHDCAVCHFVKQVVCFFALAIALLSSEAPRKFLASQFPRLISLNLPSQLQTRAPPLLS